MNGLLIINKPFNITSMDVIRHIRKLTNIKKVGHTGTLDPLATGVLLVCIGPATKKIRYFMETEKEYITTVNLSAFSETEDAQGPLHPVVVKKIPTQKDIESILPQFLGTIKQTPPRYSSIRINGKRAYTKARDDKEEFSMPPRFVTIDAIHILDYQWPNLQLHIVCQTGTYIRSLGRDIGEKLGTGGYLTKLERTKVGPFLIEDSIDLSTLSQAENIKPLALSSEVDKRNFTSIK